MELSRIIISEINDQQVIFLKELEGDRAFPILIGLFEATSIDRRVRQVRQERPPTHALMKSMLDELNVTAQDVVINNLIDHTYYAAIRVMKEGEIVEIDSRPSDAIALAVQFSPTLPIYVEDTILDQVA
jgi:bifunctional DNase/RNase